MLRPRRSGWELPGARRTGIVAGMPGYLQFAHAQT
jgi:hypothetical protein